MAKLTPKQKKFRTYMFGVAGLVVVVVVAYVMVTASSGRLPGMPYTAVRAMFQDVGSLQVADEVRENGRLVGKVSAIEGSKQGAIVTLKLDGHQPVYKDARVAVWDTSALARKFIELEPGTEQAGPLGDTVVPTSRTTSSADLYQVLDVFDPDTRTKLASALNQLGGGAAGHSQDLHDALVHLPPMLDDIGQITGTLASPDADLPGLLHSADNLVGSLNGHEQQISSLVKQLGTTFDALNVDGGKPLQDTINDLPDTLSDVRSAFGALNQPLDDTQSAVSTLRSGAASLAQATPDLRGVLREGVGPLNEVPPVAQVASPAVDDLTGTVHNLSPVVPRLSNGLDNLSVPLQVLAPYSPTIGTFIGRVRSLVSTTTVDGNHVARLGLTVVGPSVVTGGLFNDPLYPRNPYPAPGQADRDRSSLPIGIPAGGSK